jgi:hypothetical protein
MPYTTYMELLVKPEILTSYIYTDLRLATLKSVSFYLLHNVSTLNQCRKFSCVTVVCKHFASYQGYPNYTRDLIRLSWIRCCDKKYDLFSYICLVISWHCLSKHNRKLTLKYVSFCPSSKVPVCCVAMDSSIILFAAEHKKLRIRHDLFCVQI